MLIFTLKIADNGFVYAHPQYHFQDVFNIFFWLGLLTTLINSMPIKGTYKQIQLQKCIYLYFTECIQSSEVKEHFKHLANSNILSRTQRLKL